MEDKLILLEIEELRIEADPPLVEFYKLSPFVWREENVYHIALRAVNHSPIPTKKVARVYHGMGDDGLLFRMDLEPVIAPGTEDDHDGCEDPTVIVEASGYAVFYSGWNQKRKRGLLLTAVGRDIHTLEKHGRVLPDDPRFSNTKECTIVETKTGYRMLFEYSDGRESLIGVAESQALAGPWAFCDPLFFPRSGMWDSHHLSPGPFVKGQDGRLVMFYNGADAQARWRIGWVELDRDLRHVYRRCDDPLIVPSGVTSEDTDIAFASSAVVSEHIELYYSVSDRFMKRATFLRT